MQGYGKECVLGPLFKLLEASFELLIPLVVARIVDVGIGNRDQGYIVKMVLIMALLGVIGLICAVTAQYFAARAAVGFAARLRHAVMEHLLGLSYGGHLYYGDPDDLRCEPGAERCEFDPATVAPVSFCGVRRHGHGVYN